MEPARGTGPAFYFDRERRTRVSKAPAVISRASTSLHKVDVVFTSLITSKGKRRRLRAGGVWLSQVDRHTSGLLTSFSHGLADLVWLLFKFHKTTYGASSDRQVQSISQPKFPQTIKFLDVDESSRPMITRMETPLGSLELDRLQTASLLLGCPARHENSKVMSLPKTVNTTVPDVTSAPLHNKLDCPPCTPRPITTRAVQPPESRPEIALLHKESRQPALSARRRAPETIARSPSRGTTLFVLRT